MAVAIHTRQTSHLPCVVVEGAAAQYPRNYETRFGSYYETFVRDDDLWFRRSFYAGPPFAWELQVTTSGDVTHNWAYLLPWRRIVLLFEKAGADVYVTYSDDEGQTWEAPVVSISGGSHPFGLVCPFTGTEAIFAFIAATGKIHMKRRYAGADDYEVAVAIQDDASADLLFEDDDISFWVGYENPARWFAHLHPDGEAGTATFASADDGETWQRLT